jgi:DNA-binding MarR family transcriptional regulator
MEKTESAVDVRRIYRALALDEELDGVDLRVFLYLFSKLDFKSFTPVPQMEIAEALGRRKEHVSRSIRKLKAKNIILPGPKVDRSPSFRLNPNYAK